MKNIYVLLVLFFAGISAACAQQPDFYQVNTDQNPHYMQSQQKYMLAKDSLLAYSNATAQDTYKAYDFYEARQERRALRRERRYNVRMTSAQYSCYPAYGYGNYGYTPWYNGLYGAFMPSIGFRTGNWRFGW